MDVLQRLSKRLRENICERIFHSRTFQQNCGICPHFHRTPGQLRWERTSGGHLVQPHIPKQGHLEPVAQGHVQMTFEINQCFLSGSKNGSYFIKGVNEMYPHNNFSCKSVTCLSPAAKSCSVLSKLVSCLNQVELALIRLGKEVTFSHCRTGIEL